LGGHHFFLLASAVSFDGKILQSAAILPTFYVDPKPSSELKMYGLHIFWRPLRWKRGRLVHYKSVLQRIWDLKVFLIKKSFKFKNPLKIEYKIKN
jgi:hypothetical protein